VDGMVGGLTAVEAGSSAAPLSDRQSSRPNRLVALGLVAPAVVVGVVAIVVPVGLIVERSFSEPHWGVGNYEAIVHDGVIIGVLLRTLLATAVITLITLLMAYPYAYVMTRVGPGMRTLLVAIVLLPFWTSLMARTFAWIVLLQDGGPVQKMLGFVGMHDVTLLGTSTGVTFGMVQVLLPYMVLPLYSSLRTIDLKLLQAAQSLGAKRWKAFVRVYLPLSRPGIVAGTSLVFVLSLGFYITPRLLGSPKHSFVSQLIELRVERLLDFAGAGALATVLLLSTVLVLAAVQRVQRTDSVENLRGDR
jgi:putative spermidine/putrescine transport system permease protein